MQERILDTIEQLGSHDFKARANAGQVLVKLGEPAIQPLIVALTDDHLHLEEIFKVFRDIGGSAVPMLIDALNDNSDGKRQQRAAHILGQMADPRAVDPLINALHDDDAPVREEAVIGLRTLGDPRALPELIRLLKEGDQGMRAKVAWALGDFGNLTTIEPLTTATRDSDSQVRRGAVWSLGKLPNPRTMEVLQSLTSDADSEVAHLAELGLEKLKQAGDNLPEYVEREAHKAVKREERSLETATSIDAMRHSNPDVRVRVIQIIIQQGGVKNIGLLLTALDDINVNVRESVRGALVKIGEPAIDPLIKTLSSPNRILRAEAARSLGVMKATRALDDVIFMLRDEQPGVRIAAVEALAAMGDPRAVKSLTGALSDTDPQVIASVEAALTKLGKNPKGVNTWIPRLVGRMKARQDKDKK